MLAARVFDLAPADRRTAVLAWLLLPAVDLGLRLLPFRLVRRILMRLAGWLPLSSAIDPRPVAEAGYRLVAAAARRHLWAMQCLRRTLVLETLLRARGVATELRFGARRDGSGLEAHCWLVLDGVPVGESRESLARYAPLESPERPLPESD